MKQIRVFSVLFVHIFFGRGEVKTKYEKTRRHTDLRNQITQTKIEKYDSPKKKQIQEKYYTLEKIEEPIEILKKKRS